MSTHIYNNEGQNDSDIYLVKEEPAPRDSQQQIIPIEFSGDHQVVNTSNGQAIVLTLDPKTLSALTSQCNNQAVTTVNSISSRASVISSSQTINSSESGNSSNARKARRSGIAPDGSYVNQYGRHFANGRPLPENLRLEILKAYDQGVRPSQISRNLQVSHGCVSKILNKYRRNAYLTSDEQREYPSRATPPDVVEKIKEIKRDLPHLVAWEIRVKLITDNICPPEKAPSISCITRILREYSRISSRNVVQREVAEPVVIRTNSSNISTIESDSQSEVSQMHNCEQSLNPNNVEALTQQQQQILTLLQEDPLLKNSPASKNVHSNGMHQMSETDSSASNMKLDESISNPLAGLNASALITALLTLSGQPCGNPWEPLWTNQEHLLMTSNGAAMQQIVYMGNNLWKLKSEEEDIL